MTDDPKTGDLSSPATNGGPGDFASALSVAIRRASSLVSSLAVRSNGTTEAFAGGDERELSTVAKRTLRRLLQRYTGLDIHRYHPAIDTVLRYYDTILRLGNYPASDLDYWADIFEILSRTTSVTAFDVGAHRGQTVRKLMQIFPEASIHAFEPSPSVFSELSRVLSIYSNITLNNCGVGSQKSEMNFIENIYTDMSSFLEPGPQSWGESKQRIKVPITTVDDYSAEKHIERIHLLKIDTQGFDFEVLKGAERMLADGRIDLVMTEITFAKLYEGLPWFNAIYAYMAQHHGYQLTGVYDQNRKNRILSWADMVFASPLVVAARVRGVGYDTVEEQLAAAEADQAFRNRCAAPRKSWSRCTVSQ
jgi:FkbM family methyltransferase